MSRIHFGWLWLALAIGAICAPNLNAQGQRVPVQRNATRQAPPVARTAQAPAAQRPPVNANAQAIAAGAPFILSPQEEASLDQLLLDWEQAGKAIHQFEVTFTRLEYKQNAIAAGQIGPAKQPNEPVTTTGEIKYREPDKGLYVARDDKGTEVDHWVTDGKTIFLFNPDKKRLEAHQLPKELQGKGIADGPLPFLFGTEAVKLKARYWLRVDPPGSNPEPGKLLLEAVPKFQQDAQNYKRAQVILDAQSLTMLGLQIHHPDGKSRTVHVFGKPVINPKFQFLQKDFSKPKTPEGWMYFPVPVPEEQPAAPRAAARPNVGNARGVTPRGGKPAVVR